MNFFRVFIADFCYEPDDFEKWKSAFEKSDKGNDIFAFKKKLLEQIRINSFTYQNNGITMRLPNRYYTLFRSIINNAFTVFDLNAYLFAC